MSFVSNFTNQTMNESDLFTLKENYANMIIDGMDIDTLAQFAYDSIMDNLKDYGEKDIEAEIIDLYGEETYNDLADVDTIKVSYGDTLRPHKLVILNIHLLLRMAARVDGRTTYTQNRHRGQNRVL